MARPRKVKVQEIDGEICDRIYKELGNKLQGFPAVRKRIQDLIRETQNAEQVELVAISLARRERDNFSAASLNWGSYDWARRALDIPDGAWAYALWADKLPDGDSIQRSIDYWIGLWKDAYEEEDFERPRVMLERLWDTFAVPIEDVGF